MRTENNLSRTVTKLADGRELIYFSHSGPSDPPRDRRELPPPPPASEIRYDPLLDEWVAVAAHRQSRAVLPPSDECPLCPSTDQRATEIPARQYEVVVFENRFPAFASRDDSLRRLSGAGSATDGHRNGLYERRPGGGRCEVVCYTADHDASFASLTPERVRLVVDVWADRTAELSRLPGVREVFCFENRGKEIGVSLHHPHGQIHAFPFVAPRTRQMLQSAVRHLAQTGRNVFADVLATERRAESRVVAANEHWTAFVPAFARWPFEVHIYPHRQLPDIPALSDAERDAFGPVYVEVLRRLDGVYDLAMPYVSAWHQAPVADPHRELAYLHLQLFSNRRAPGKLKYPAGTEAAMGVFLNDVDPDEAARLLRASEIDAEKPA